MCFRPCVSPFGIAFASRTLQWLALWAAAVLPCLGQWKYPPTKTTDACDTYFGHTYKDPYRWLEDLKDQEVQGWFKAQAELTESWLKKIPAKDALAEEWLALSRLKPATYGRITCKQGRVFYMKTLGDENVGKLFYRESWNGPEKPLFDAGPYKSGVVTTIHNFWPSWDGKYVALGLTSGGAEYSELRILDVERAALLSDSFYPSIGVYGWMEDGQSFLYDAGKVTDIRSNEIKLNRKTKLHRLGSDFSADPDMFSSERNPELGIEPKDIPVIWPDESCPNYVIGEVHTVKRELRLYFVPATELKNERIHWQVLCRDSDKIVRGYELHGDYVYAITHAGAPNYKLVRTALHYPDWAHAETIIPEAADPIQSMVKSKHYLFVLYSNGVVGRIVKYDLATGKSSEVKLPASGNVGLICPDWRTDRCLVFITSWTSPVTIYEYEAEEEKFAKSIFNSDVLYPGSDELVAEEVEVRGHDGTMVPLSIIHQRGIPMDGSNCCILEGYGAYGVSIKPRFDFRYSLARRGVVLAFAHVRGGGEKGEAWYKAGFKTTKPNTWKDFTACAEYLIGKGYTSSPKLAVWGKSAGGILISRAITERPELFRAAVCYVGCANALRMEFSASGPANAPEFGTVKDPVECKALAEMDGLLHVKNGVRYPALIGVGGWNDPRVPPWQPGKFVAAVQAASTSGNPALLKVNYDSGHSSEEKVVSFKNSAALHAFLLWQTGHKDFQPAEAEP